MATSQRWCIPKTILPGYYFQLQDMCIHRYNPGWFFKWYPNDPCYYCDSGVIVRVFLQSLSQKVFYYKWTYIQLKEDAKRVRKPHGLYFKEGNSTEIPLYIRRIIINFLNKKDKTKIIVTEDEYDQLRLKDPSLPSPLTTEKQLLKAASKQGYRLKGFEGMRNRGEKTSQELYNMCREIYEKEMEIERKKIKQKIRRKKKEE